MSIPTATGVSLLAFPASTAVGLLVIVCLVALSAFFSSSETAVFTLSEEWLERADASTPGLAALRELRGDPHRLLVTILVGNNVVNVAIASITTVLAVQYLPTGTAVTVATVAASFVVLVFGEIVPKSYGLGHADTWSLRVARPVGIAERVLYPLVVVFDFITRRMNAAIGGESGIERPYLDEPKGGRPGVTYSSRASDARSASSCICSSAPAVMR